MKDRLTEMGRQYRRDGYLSDTMKLMPDRSAPLRRKSVLELLSYLLP